MASCEIRQEGDELVCKCGLRWDVKEAPPDRCPKNKRRHVADDVRRTEMAQRQQLTSRAQYLPIVLEPMVAWRMVHAFHRAVQRGEPHDRAMQRAYEEFLIELP